MPQLFLASKSPRRRAILESMGIANIVVVAQGPAQLTAFAGDEVQIENEAPADYVVRTARDKALQAFARLGQNGVKEPVVLAADTVVICQGEILGKPIDREQAREFLSRLSNRVHEVRTAVAVGTAPANLQVAVSVSHVHFTRLEPEQIEEYIRTDEPYDKAGGYAVQGLAGLFIDRIEGSYSGIMGLPVFETAQLLRPYGLTAL